MNTQYDSLADLYDLVWGNSQSHLDIEAYLSIAKKRGGPILEMGTGTGRVAITLVENGFSVVALDVSEKMLAVARARADKFLDDVQRNRIEFLTGDMAEPGLIAERSFPLIILPFSVLWESRNKECVQKTLNNAYALLDDAGVLFFDCSYYGPGGRQLPGSGIHSKRQCPDGNDRHWTFQEKDTCDLNRGVTRKILLSERRDKTGRLVERREDSIDRVYLSPDEVKEMLSIAGFNRGSFQVFGSFDLITDFDDEVFTDPTSDLYRKARQVWHCTKNGV